ncbi:MAG: Uma2 family endonuclease [Verrucomicrobiales bacterium]
MVLSPHQVVQPDILFIARDRMHMLEDALKGPADLVVEVTSLSSRRRDRIDKRDLYEHYGVKEYWIVDPESRTVEVLALEQPQLKVIQRATLGQKAVSRLLPGFEIAVDQLFPQKSEA